MYLRENTLLQGGKYKITRYISHGGFGCTYEAVNTTWKNRRVAIKELFVSDFCNRDSQTGDVIVATQSKIPLFDKLRNKFLDEADRLNNLLHPGIVRVTDAFEENGTAYYVMDYIDGYSLREVVEKQGTLTECEALHYIRQVALSLQYVHEKKLLHLDIKPANVMIGQDNKCVLIDFGVSKQYDEVSGENTSTLMGYTIGYAPLEQMGNEVEEFLPATDIYSLGATLYYLLTAQVPISANRIAGGATLPPLPDSVSETTRRAVEAAMTINKHLRPQSIADFLAILDGKNLGSDITDKDSDKTQIDTDCNSGEESKHPVEEDKKHREEEHGYQEYEQNPEPSPLRELWIALVSIVIGVGVVFGLRGCQSHAGGEPDATDSIAIVDKININTDEGRDVLRVGKEPNTREETLLSSDERRDAPPVRETAEEVDAEQTRLAEENRRLREKIRKDSIEAAKKAEAERIAKEVRQAQDESRDAPLVRKTSYDTDQDKYRNLIPVVYVSGGTFKMGATSEQGSDADSDEKPTHQVTVSSFYMGKYEVTQAQWEAVMGTTVRQQRDKADLSYSLYGIGGNYPIYYVSYNEAVEFCRKLSTLTGRTYRLPTEAEWEYAARGGNQSRGYKYSGSNDLSSVAWYGDNSNTTSHAVGTKQANELGLYDMSGNVWEWCSDWNGKYSNSPQTNPKGPGSGSSRVNRGGSWGNDASSCRVSDRGSYPPSLRDYDLGFRVVLEP